jgi:hypothetical protein
MSDVDESGDWLDHWATEVRASADRAATLSRRVAALTGRASNADDSIRVTVDSSGRLHSIDLDDRATELRGDELTRRIRAVIRKAQSDLAAQVPTEVEATVGADAAIGQSVIRAFSARFPPDISPAPGAAGSGRSRSRSDNPEA